MSRPGLELGVRVSAFAFSQTKIIFKLTIDISKCKIVLEVEYFIKSMIYQYDLSNVKIFQKNSLFQPEMIRRPLFWFKDTKKIQVN